MKGIDGRDVLALVGLGLLGYGLWLEWPALAFVVTGAILLVLAIASAWLRTRSR